MWETIDSLNHEAAGLRRLISLGESALRRAQGRARTRAEQYRADRLEARRGRLSALEAAIAGALEAL
jgi:hypothetical protein